MARQRLVREWKLPGGYNEIEWSPDGLLHAVSVWDRKRASSVWTAEGECLWGAEGTIVFRWSPDSRSIGCRYPTLQIRDARTGRVLSEHDIRASQVCWSKNGGQVAVVGGQTLRIV